MNDINPARYHHICKNIYQILGNCAQSAMKIHFRGVTKVSLGGGPKNFGMGGEHALMGGGPLHPAPYSTALAALNRI